MGLGTRRSIAMRHCRPKSTVTSGRTASHLQNQARMSSLAHQSPPHYSACPEVPCSTRLNTQPTTRKAGVKHANTVYFARTLTSPINLLWTARRGLGGVAQWGWVQCDMSGNQSRKRQNTSRNASGWAATRIECLVHYCQKRRSIVQEALWN